MPQLYLVTQNKRFLFYCLFLITTMGRSAIALERSQDPCRAFVLSGSETDYGQCYDLVRKVDKEGGKQAVLSWLRDPTLQTKFTNDVASGKLLPITLAFDIIPLLDGELGEIVSISLGQSITKSPEIFLTQLQAHYSDIYRYRLGPITGSLGSQYVDKFEKQLKFLNKRRAAVSSVRDPSLKKIKQVVIKELDQAINERESLINSEKK